MNRLIDLSSNDETIHYQYEYWNSSHRITSVKDAIRKTEVKRFYNTKNQLTKEIFPNGFYLEKTYDEQNHLKELKFPDHSKIVYTYSPMSMKCSSYSKTKNLLYKHEVQKSNNAKNKVSENLIFNLRTRTTNFIKKSCL